MDHAQGANILGWYYNAATQCLRLPLIHTVISSQSIFSPTSCTFCLCSHLSTHRANTLPPLRDVFLILTSF